jgi:hypothetical protein
MEGIKINYDDIEEVVVTKDRQLLIKLKRNEKTKKIKNHLVKQSGSDHLDRNVRNE